MGGCGFHFAITLIACTISACVTQQNLHFAKLGAVRYCVKSLSLVIFLSISAARFFPMLAKCILNAFAISVGLVNSRSL